MIHLLKRLFRSRDPKQRIYIMIRGGRLVQGGYTVDIEKQIYALNLKGWMRPHDSFVELDLEGRSGKVTAFLEKLKEVPLFSTVHQCKVAYQTVLKHYTVFRRR